MTHTFIPKKPWKAVTHVEMRECQDSVLHLECGHVVTWPSSQITPTATKCTTCDPPTFSVTLGASYWSGLDPRRVESTCSSDEWYAAIGLRQTAESVTNSLGAFFRSLLSPASGIEAVYWMFEGETLRIWSVIDEPDFARETIIYAAQVKFMDKMPDWDCDFSVIYRQGRDLPDLLPTHALLVPAA